MHFHDVIPLCSQIHTHTHTHNTTHCVWGEGGGERLTQFAEWERKNVLVRFYIPTALVFISSYFVQYFTLVETMIKKLYALTLMRSKL
jgi:hypothetical protein